MQIDSYELLKGITRRDTIRNLAADAITHGHDATVTSHATPAPPARHGFGGQSQNCQKRFKRRP
jgi:hypothetical protein